MIIIYQKKDDLSFERILNVPKRSIGDTTLKLINETAKKNITNLEDASRFLLENNKIKPIYIVGVPRCGSTLIEKIIGSGNKSIPMGEEVIALEHLINTKVLEKKSLNLGDAKSFGDELVNIYKKTV